MAQKLVQTQEQKLAQVMRLSQQQMLQVHLLEMPLTELEENINTELDDNPALERDDNEMGLTDSEDNFADGDDDSSDFDVQTEKEERRRLPPLFLPFQRRKEEKSARRGQTARKHGRNGTCCTCAEFCTKNGKLL